MPATAIVGLQWGDEGKAKILDELAERSDIICRYQGGSNAGHTVVVAGERLAFHTVPSGIAHPGKLCAIGNGVALDPVALLAEIRALEAKGLEVRSRLIISERAHLVLAYHKELEAAEEHSRGSGAIGTTLRGIGPCYTDKAARVGFRVADLLRPDGFRRKVAERLKRVNMVLERVFGRKPLQQDQVIEEALSAGRELAPMVGDVTTLLNDALDRGRNVLFEGAQGTLLDVDFGTYPFVTSSSASVLGVSAGTGVAPQRIDRVVGVMKAYTTRVGAGPFPTELSDETGARLRERGREFGTTTGRPRRCGWFDAVATRFAARLNAVTEVAITKLDVLTGEPVVKIATSYALPDGSRTDKFPASLDDLEAARPIYEERQGWSEEIRDIRRSEDLPATARAYVERLANLVGVKAALISVGEGRGATIRL